MEPILYRSEPGNWLANIDWAFHIFWATYFSTILGVVAYVTS